MASVCAVVILSHRSQFTGRAFASAAAQTVPCQVLVQYDREAWPEKVNEIVQAVRTPFFLLLCDDDLLDPRYVEHTIALAETADLVYTDRIHWRVGQDPARGEGRLAKIHDVQGVPKDFGVRTAMRPDWFMFGTPLPMTHLVRTAFWRALGGYDGRIPHADGEFWYRAVKAGARLSYLPEPLFWYHEHPDQLSRQVASMLPSLVAFHRKHFLDFGYAFDQPRIEGTKWHVDIIPEAERVAYARAHFPEILAAA